MIENGIKENLTEKFRLAASTNTGRVHIVPGHDGWSVKKEGSKRAMAVKATKQDALKVAHGLKHTSLIVVHKKDGSVQSVTKAK